MAKRKGFISQTYIDRDSKVLPDLIRRAKHLATYPVSMGKLCHIAAGLPTDKFYISDDAAYEYMRKRMLAGVVPKYKSPYKQRLFEALYTEVTNMLQSEKYREMGWKQTTMLALRHPAPCVGLTPYMVREAVLRRLRRKRKENE